MYVFNNEMVGSQLIVNEKTGFVECSISKFPLTYGEFNTRLIMKVNDQETDRIENAFHFYVHDSDFFDTGSRNAQGRQGVYVQHHWE